MSTELMFLAGYRNYRIGPDPCNTKREKRYKLMNVNIITRLTGCIPVLIPGQIASFVDRTLAFDKIALLRGLSTDSTSLHP